MDAPLRLALAFDAASPTARRSGLTMLEAAHLAAGARGVVMAHGVRKAFADRFMIVGAVVGGIVATVIMLGMCGMRI